MYADVVLPLPLDGVYTYSLPAGLEHKVQVGCRVLVPFGTRKMYTGIVMRLHNAKPDYPTKDILELLDETPILLPDQLKLWHWIADYYVCSVGEVFKAALPSGLKLESESVVESNVDFEADHPLKPSEQMILDILSDGSGKKVGELQRTANIQNILPVVQRSLRGIGQLIAEIAPQLVETVAIALIQSIPDLLRAVYQMIIGIANGIYQGIVALFTGKSTIGEVTAQLNGITASAGAAADSTEELADATTEAGKAAKKAKKSLAGFDELILLKDKNIGSISGSGESVGADAGGFTANVTTKKEEAEESEGITAWDIIVSKIMKLLQPLWKTAGLYCQM